MVHIWLIETYYTQDHEMYHQFLFLSHCIMINVVNSMLYKLIKTILPLQAFNIPIQRYQQPINCKLNLTSPKINILQSVS